MNASSRARFVFASIVVALAACATEPRPIVRADLAAIDARIAEKEAALSQAALRGDVATASALESEIARLREQRDETAKPPATSAEWAEEKLASEARRAEEALRRANESGDPAAIARASNDADQAHRKVDAERARRERLEDLRRRTPARVVVPEASASRPSSAPAASRPAIAADESGAARERDELSKRIVDLIELRTSAGDGAGASRVRQRLAILRYDFEQGRRADALAGLRKLAREADR